MKKLVIAILAASAALGPALLQAQTPPAKAPSTSAALKQLEHDWSDAAKAGDVDKLSQIIADDWTALAPDGKKLTKQAFLDGIKSGKIKTESMEFGPMDVKVLGSVGVVQGSDTEKSMYEGKDSSGKYVWTDVFAKRDGKWVAVRSQLTMLK
jgi:ketosteroid isomerase-like protein